MNAAARNRVSFVDWSVAARSAPGQQVSGDMHVVAPWSSGVLIGVVDGLGHGDEATIAARVAVDVLEQHAGEPVVPLVQHCHRALRHTRGVVMTLLSIDTREETMSVIGIGNVETLVLRANPRMSPRRTNVLLRGGVVGYQLPPLQFEVLPIAPGDVAVFCTDGIREDFADLVRCEEPPARIAEQVMAQKFRGNDDGLVLACKYVGQP